MPTLSGIVPTGPRIPEEEQELIEMPWLAKDELSTKRIAEHCNTIHHNVTHFHNMHAGADRLYTRGVAGGLLC